MKGKMKYFRKKLCAFGLAAAAVAGGVAAPVAVNMSHADEAIATQNRTANFNKSYSSVEDPGTFVDTTITGRNTNNPVGADNVMIYKGDGSKGQQWNLEDAGNGNYLVKNLYNYYLDVDNGVDANGRNVNTWHKNGSAAQQWKFTRVSGKNLANVAEGDYMIYSKVGNRVLNATGDGTGNGTNLQIYDPVDSNRQQRKIPSDS